MQPLHQAPHDINMGHFSPSPMLHPLQHEGMACAHAQLHAATSMMHDGMANLPSSAHALLHAASSCAPAVFLFPPGFGPSQPAVAQQAARMQAAAGMQASGMHSPTGMLGAIDAKVASLTAPGLRITDERADLKRLRAIEKRSKAAERQRICRARKAAIQVQSQAHVQQLGDTDPLEMSPTPPDFEMPLTDEQLVYRAFYLPGSSQEATAYQCDRLLDECDKGVYDVSSIADDEQRRAVAMAILRRPRLVAVLGAAGIPLTRAMQGASASPRELMQESAEQLVRLQPPAAAAAVGAGAPYGYYGNSYGNDARAQPYGSYKPDPSATTMPELRAARTAPTQPYESSAPESHPYAPGGAYGGGYAHAPPSQTPSPTQLDVVVRASSGDAVEIPASKVTWS
ncbi:hypothetical protein T492DRAFT_847258 [Pavlovales sp. CCMP2436]|nr:hypothetical protein T492DRAFT_847258 [Pavlovales sp. CCMP2436]|mmetsp:Transcript_16883/g.43138  ORF Transcript_16883/g.43138 Transcript_16883/m.43138 type:complete len:398 (+) Transcript_16883:51-1244(+)